MRTYQVFVADKFTKCPLMSYEVKALTKWHAKRKVFTQVCQYDKTYLITASRY